MTADDRKTASPRWARIGLLLAGYAAIIVVGHQAGLWLEAEMDSGVLAAAGLSKEVILIGGLILFTVLLALPFVPGIEVSVALFAIFGGAVALPVYVATVTALMIAFLAGRLVPLGLLARFFDMLGLKPASDMVRRLEPLPGDERLAVLTSQAPAGVARSVARLRELALILALNLPGNGLIGGGGGIALIAGMSRMFPPVRAIAAIMVAAIPIPLLFALASRIGWDP